MPESEWIVIRIRRRIAHMIASILKGSSAQPHYEASKEKDPLRAAALRDLGNDIHETAKQIERTLNEGDDP